MYSIGVRKKHLYIFLPIQMRNVYIRNMVSALKNTLPDNFTPVPGNRPDHIVVLNEDRVRVAAVYFTKAHNGYFGRILRAPRYQRIADLFVEEIGAAYGFTHSREKKFEGWDHAVGRSFQKAL